MAAPCTVLPHLYFSNAPPTPAEAAFIQRDNQHLRGVISHYENYLRWNASVLSALRRFSPEILGEIFQHTVASSPLGEEGRKQVIDLCLVSRGWCNAAFSCHQLWDRVRVKASLLSFHRVVAWLDRAGTCPKTLEVVANEPCHDAVPPHGQLTNPELLRLLSKGLHLDHLSLLCSDPECFKSMVEALESFEPRSEPTSPRPWDSVRSLTLDFSNDWDDSASLEDSPFLHVPETITSFQLHLPKPSSISWDHSGMGPVLHLPPSLAQNLKNFTISGDWDAHHLFNLLVHCANLEALTIDHILYDRVGMGSYRHIEYHARSLNISLPKLHTLRLRRTLCYIFPFLQLIDMPSLINLDFGLHLRDTMWALSDLRLFFMDFIKSCRNPRRIQYLRLADSPISSHFLDIVGALPRLTHLVLENLSCDMKPSDNLFKALELQKRSHPDRPCLPQLTVLELHRLPPNFNFLSLSEYLRVCNPEMKELIISYEKFLEPSEFTDYYVGVGDMKERSGTLVNIYRCAD